MNETAIQLRDSLRQFIQQNIAPFYEQWERDEIFPRELWNQFGESGFLAADISESNCGLGIDFETAAIIQGELAYAGYADISTALAVHSDIVSHYVENSGSAAQREKYLPGMINGSIVGAIAMTEPGMGSDLQGMRSTAIQKDGKWILNGSKTFITNGQHADLIIVAARTDLSASGAKGTSLFLVDADLNGVTKGRNLEKIGMHTADTSELHFEDVVLSDDDILGQLHGGFGVLMAELGRERLALASAAVAACEGALDITIRYTKERSAFGQALANFQNTKFVLADLATQTQAAKSLVRDCASDIKNGGLSPDKAAMAKLFSTEVQGRVVDGCLQMFGGYGYMREYPISRFFVDARVQRIYGGTSEIMKEIISRSLFKE